MPPLLELEHVSKHFGGVMALRDVDFTLLPGEIHGLVGENGAGKSTTMKIIAGVHTDFDGVMKIQRQATCGCALRGDALANSIGMVHQELSIVPDLTVAENVFLGNQPLTPFGTVDWSPDEPRGEAPDRQPGPRDRSDHHHGTRCPWVCNNWWNSRAFSSRARRSSFSTNRPPPCRRPK